MSKCRHLLRALCDRHRHTHFLVQATNKELELRQGRLVEAQRVVEEAMQQTEALLGRQVGGLAAVLAGRLCVPPSKWVRLEEQLQAGTRTPMYAATLNNAMNLCAYLRLLQAVLDQPSSPFAQAGKAYHASICTP